MILINKENYTRLFSREKWLKKSFLSNENCFYCDSKLLEIGSGIEDIEKCDIPLYECLECKYVEIMVNDNNHGVIKKVERFY